MAVAAALVALLAGGCGGGGETVEEASQAVASLISRDDCLKLQELSRSVSLALGGAVISGIGAEAQFLAGFAARAPSEIGDDVAVVRRALDALARGQEVAVPDQPAVRAAAANLASWAGSICPG